MSWMQKLYRTYESILEQGVTDHAEPLTPVGHTIQHAHTSGNQPGPPK